MTQADFASTRNDGSAAILLTSVERAKEFTKNPVYVTSSNSRTGPSDFWNQTNPLSYPALEKSVKKSFKKSGMQVWDLDLISIDTKATIMAPIALEAMEVWKFPALKEISDTINNLIKSQFQGSHIRFQNDKEQEIIINPCGSTYVRGNIPGVSGIYRLISVFQQLRGEGKNQIHPKPTSALLQEQSASGTKQMVNTLEVSK